VSFVAAFFQYPKWDLAEWGSLIDGLNG